MGLFLPQALGLGKGVVITMMDSTVTATEFTSLLDTVRDLIPANPIASFAEGNMLQVLVFAIVVGVACLPLKEKAKPFVDVCIAVMPAALNAFGTCSSSATLPISKACAVGMKEALKK